MRQSTPGLLGGRTAGLALFSVALSLVLAACAPAAAPAPTAAPAKPTEAPAAKPADGKPADAAKPAAPAAPAPAKPAQQVTIKSAFTSTSATLAVPTAAVEGGFFAEEGLEVSLTRIQAGTPMLSAIRGGDVPIAFVGAQQIVEADLKGADFVILAAFIETLGQQIYVDRSIQTPEQLKGKALGVSNFGAITHVAGLVGVEHLKLKDQVTFIATGGPPETIAAMQTGKVNGGVFSPPDSFKARDLGFVQLLDVATTGAKAVTSSIATTKKWLNENPELAERYVRASIRATHKMINDKEFGMKVIGKHAGIEDTKVLSETYDYYRDQYQKDPTPSEAGLKQAIDLALENIPEAKDAKPAQFLDLSILNKIKASGLLEQLYGKTY